MKTYKLEKEIKLYKMQFDDMCQQLFQSYIIDRLGIEIDGILFKVRYMLKNNLDIHKLSKLQKKFNTKGLELRKHFALFLYHFLIDIIQIDEPFHLEDIKDVLAMNVTMDASYINFTMVLISESKEYLEYVDNKIEEGKVFNMFPDQYMRFYTDSYNDGIAKAFPELFENKHQSVVGTGNDSDVFVHNFTFQVTEACNLSCFTEDTKVFMADTTWKNISDVNVGDIVMGFTENPKDNNGRYIIPSKVERIYMNRTNEIFSVRSKDNKNDVLVTGEHPFLTDKGWKEVRYLTIDDEVRRFESEEHTKVDISQYKQELIVYNLETSTHTYMANGYMVHNCTYCLLGDSKILMSNFTEKDISDIKIGDEILAFDEFPEEKGRFRKLKTAKVTHLFENESEDIYKLKSMAGGRDLFITGNHPVLTDNGWKNVNNIDNDKIMKFLHSDTDFYDTDINDIEYIKGYFLGAFIGDGTVRLYHDDDGFIRYFSRFIVKDDEMNERMREYAKILGFDFYDIPFKISSKYSMVKEAMLSRREFEYYKFNEIYYENLTPTRLNESMEFIMGLIAGIYDAEGTYDGYILRIINSNPYVMYLLEQGFKKLNIKWVYNTMSLTKNLVRMSIRLFSAENIIKFLKSAKPVIKRKGLSNLINHSLFKSYDMILEKTNLKSKVYNIETTTGTYIANGYMVHNCYQANKTPQKMTFSTAKKFIDNLLEDKYGYINKYNSPAIILEFIGGEPLMEIDLIRESYEYFLKRCYELDHPWFTMHRISICSNGLAYFNDNVQDFFKEYSHQVSFNISIDGNRELHDSCRIQPNKEGSYDIDMAALNHYNKHYNSERNSKMTLAPSNIKYLYDSTIDFIKNGMTVINMNCVFEEGWTIKSAREEYFQLKKLADYIIDNDLEYLFVSIFGDRQEDMNSKDSDSNKCGGSGSMLSLRPNGEFYPCIRYMPSSIGCNVESVSLGTLQDGMIGREENSKVLYKMDRNTRRAQSNDLCFECPIGNNCPGCIALGYQTFGVLNKATTFHCIIHFSETLANVYYWNRINLKHPEYDLGVRKNMVPNELAKKIIGEEELYELKMLEIKSIINTIQK